MKRIQAIRASLVKAWRPIIAISPLEIRENERFSERKIAFAEGKTLSVNPFHRGKQLFSYEKNEEFNFLSVAKEYFRVEDSYLIGRHSHRENFKRRKNQNGKKS